MINKAKHMEWRYDNTGILNIQKGKKVSDGHNIYKSLLENESKLLPKCLRMYIMSYIHIDILTIIDDSMLYNCALLLLATESGVKVSIRESYYDIGDTESGVLLLKLILLEYSL